MPVEMTRFGESSATHPILLSLCTAYVLRWDQWRSCRSVSLGLGNGCARVRDPSSCCASTAGRESRASAHGLFTAAYGIAWLLGSVVIGLRYERSIRDTVIFYSGAEFLSIPVFSLILWRVYVSEPAM